VFEERILKSCVERRLDSATMWRSSSLRAEIRRASEPSTVRSKLRAGSFDCDGIDFDWMYENTSDDDSIDNEEVDG
jgi:hypothetical protein